MDKGLGESRDISETEPPPKYKHISLEQRIYSEEYTELNGFLQNIDPEVKTSQDLEKRIRGHLRIGSLAKRGFEKTSEIYNENSEPFDESLYLLEKTQTPTLLHKYVKDLKKSNKTTMKGLLTSFEDRIKEVAFVYRGQVENRYKKGLPKKIKLSHFEGLDYILKHCNRKELQTRNDVVEALMLAQEIGMSDVTIHRWDRKKVDNKKVGSVAIAFFKRYYDDNRTEVYNKFKDKIAEKFGRTMSKSTFDRYVNENRETPRLTIEPDISEPQRNIG